MEKADQVRLNHELLIWVGFTLTNGVWSYPDGVTVDNGVPYFPEDETACFKWLVPKLKGETNCIRFLQDDEIPTWDCHLMDRPRNTVSAETAETPALALCLAIQKLIRSK